MARDNSKLKTVEIDIKNSGEDNWTNILTKEVDDSICLVDTKLNMVDMPEGDYTIRARAIDEAGNLGDYVEVVYTLDATPAISTLSANTGDLCINLNMEISKDEDFSYIEIYRRKVDIEGNALEEYSKIYTGIDSSYKDEGIEPWQDYEYKLHPVFSLPIDTVVGLKLFENVD